MRFVKQRELLFIKIHSYQRKLCNLLINTKTLQDKFELIIETSRVYSVNIKFCKGKKIVFTTVTMERKALVQHTVFLTLANPQYFCMIETVTTII